MSQEFQDALTELQAEQARRGVGSIDNAAGQSFRNRTGGPAGQNAISTTTTGGSNVSGSGTGQAQLEENRLGIDPDRNTSMENASTTTSGSPYADAFGTYTGSRALTNAADNIREAQAQSAANPYSNLPTAVTPAGVDPRSGAMQYSGPSSSAATGGSDSRPFVAATAQTPVQAQMATAFGQTNVTPQSQVVAPTVQTPGFDPSGGNYAVTPQQVAYSTSASRGSEDPYDPRGIMPTSEQIALQPQRTITPTTQSNTAGMRQGSNVYVNPNTGSYDEVPVVPKKVVVGGTGGGNGGGGGGNDDPIIPVIVDTVIDDTVIDDTVIDDPVIDTTTDTTIIDGPKIVPIDEAVVGDVISKLPDDQLTGNFGQDYQLFNPDIDYTNAYVASNNQIVGTLDPKYDPSYDGPTYSASDFQIGASTTGTDFSAYDPKLTDDSTIATNASGSKVSVGYGMGQVDPALAELAGYNTDKAFTYVDPNTGSYDEVPTTLKKVTDTSNAVETVTPSKTLIAETTADSIRNEDPGGALYDEFGDIVEESFRDAFSRHESAGKSTFTHKGNLYTTEKAAEKAATSDTGTSSASTVATSNVVNKTGTAVVKEDQSKYGDAGEGNVWAVQPGTNAVTKVKDNNNNNNTSTSITTTTTTRTAAEIQKDINAEVGGGKPWTSKANDLVKELDAAKANKDNNDKPDKPSGGGGSCCFIMLEARYGNGTMDEVVRRYRDEYMTDRNRRGYYKLAEVLVPLMRKSKVFKWVVTKTFADPLVSYGKYYYGQGKVGVLYSPVKSFWMKVFNVIGGETEFIRENGEVV